MIKNTMWFAAIAAVVVACSASGSKSSISGTIKGAEGQAVYLERLVNNRWDRTDSTMIAADGTFNILPAKGMEMDYYRVALSEDDFLYVIADSTETISVEGEAGKLYSEAKVSGSDHTELLREFEASIEDTYKQEEELAKAFQTMTTDEEKDQARTKVLELRKQRIDKAKQWLESNSATPAALMVIQKLDINADQNIIRKVLTDASKQCERFVYYKLLKQQVDRVALQKKNVPQEEPEQQGGGIIAIGKMAPEISMPDPSGKVRKLSDLKGKVVLIDFWASWCGPCRRENPNVVAAYNKYNKKGFEVFSVSLDKEANAWKEAIKADGLIWKNHVSDLKFWSSKAAADYGVHSIPFPVLIDKEGKVVAFGNNIRGQMLETNLEQLLGR
jgi:thiol-disulfide isomerase/thioredoxin